MHEVTDDRDVDPSGFRLGLDPVDLVTCAVDERDPGAFMARVTAAGLVEGGSDDLRRVVDDARREPLVLGLGCRWSLCVAVTPDDVTGHPDDRRHVVDRCDLGHALPVALLALGEPGLELRLRPGGRFRRAWTQGVGPHHDPLAVTREDEHVGVVDRFAVCRLVEVLEVDRRALRELFHLALSDLDAAGPADRLLRFFEAPSGRLDGRQLPKPVGVDLFWQVEGCIRRVEVLLAAAAVGEAPHGHRAEDGGQRSLVVGLDRPVRRTSSSDDVAPALLVLRAQVEVVLKELTDHLAHVRSEPRFELGVLEPERVGAAQVADDRLEVLARRAERVRPGDLGGRLHARRLARRAFTLVTRVASSARASASRSFTALR